jgi:DNA-binding CsgD family transcriptional regulator
MALLRPSPDGGAAGPYRPVSPEIGLASLLARTEAELYRRQQEIAAIRKAIAAIALEYDAIRGDRQAAFERLDGLDAVRSRLEELVHKARSEYASFTPGGPSAFTPPEARHQLDRRALERGVLIRNVYQDGCRNHAETLRYAQWLAARGGQTRSCPTLPMSLVIVDRRVALVPLDPAEPRRGALEVTAPGVVEGLCALFEHVWAISVPFGEAPADGHGLSPVERTLLRLLLDGVTDETAARRLGVSLRTVRRTMSSLMSRLGARSRFEAGARAVQRGWL